MSRSWLVILPALLVLSNDGNIVAEDVGLEAPAGFRVELFADDDLATNIYSMTIDAKGRVVVSGPGYVRRLLDTDNDGRADLGEMYSELPASGAQGLCFDGPDLYCTGDDGLWRLRDTNADGRADGPPELLAVLRNREHGAHGIVIGPDGCLYVACGNDAGVDERLVQLASSPILKPQSGAVIRVQRDHSRIDVYADGFRNHYDLAFSQTGHLFTVDSDGERDHHLPWYAPTRVFDVAQGQSHGWLEQGSSRSWSRPESFFDNVERVAELGRGSPTGIVAYRHVRFPDRYRNGLFSCCWTMGRVYFLPLSANGGSFESEPEIFLWTSDNVGFAPVDMAVGPAGELYVAIGGRGTRGGVFRITHEDSVSPEVDGDSATPLDKVLRAQQPDASWSRAVWETEARLLGAQPFVDAMIDTSRPLSDRIRAIEILTQIYEGVPTPAAKMLLDEPAKSVLQARLAWSLGCSPGDRDRQRMLAELTSHHDAHVLRTAWEALAGQESIESVSTPRWFGGLASSSSRVRAAVVEAARRGGKESFERASEEFVGEFTPRQQLGVYRIRHAKFESTKWTNAEINACVAIAVESRDPRERLEAVRMVQLAMGDVQTEPAPPSLLIGYVANSPEVIDAERRYAIAQRLGATFPSGEERLDLELARVVGMLGEGVRGILERMSSKWTEESAVADDLHYLMAAARVPGPRSRAFTLASAGALVALDEKMASAGQFVSRTWPERVGVTIEHLVARDPGLSAALVNHEGFGRPAHALWVARLPEGDYQAAARRLLAVAQEASADDEAAWTAELVEALRVLPDGELLPALRERWENYRVRDSIALILASRPNETDRTRLVEALTSSQPEVVQQAAGGLLALSGRSSVDEIVTAVTALRAFCPAGEPIDGEATLTEGVTSRLVAPYRTHRRALVDLLSHWSGHRFEAQQSADTELLTAYADWSRWLRAEYPNEADRLSISGQNDTAAWIDRWSGVDWDAGDSTRGAVVFERRSCHRCHSGNSRLGPDLTGVASRMARDDLFTAILDPSRDVAPPYRTTLVATHGGQVYHGVLVYESPDGTLIQTGPDTTVRVTGEEMAVQQPSDQSIMPTGLLDGIRDDELADLYAFLRSLVPAGEAEHQAE